MTKKKVTKKKKIIAKKGGNKNAKNTRQRASKPYLPDGSMRPLLPKHKAFADHYRTNGFNPVDAYLKIYVKQSKPSAAAAAGKLLARPEVIDYLATKSREAEAKVDLTQESILRDIIELKEMCMGKTETPIYVTDKDGEIHTDKVKALNAQGAKGSLEMLAKHMKMFTDAGTNIEKMQVNFNFDLAGD